VSAFSATDLCPQAAALQLFGPVLAGALAHWAPARAAMPWQVCDGVRQVRQCVWRAGRILVRVCCRRAGGWVGAWP
jgi:hypothetical protein